MVARVGSTRARALQRNPEGRSAVLPQKGGGAGFPDRAGRRRYRPLAKGGSAGRAAARPERNRRVAKRRVLEEAVPLLENVRGCVTALFTLLEAYGLRRGRPSVVRAFEQTVLHWQRGSALVDPKHGWIKFAKYKFATYVYHMTQQAQCTQPPPSPVPPPFLDNPRWLAKGCVGRFCNQLLKTRERIGFLSSIGHIKTACPRPGEDFLDESVAKTVEALCTEHKSPPDGFLAPWQAAEQAPGVRFFLDRETMCAQLERTVDEVFQVRQTAEQRGQPATYHQFTDEMRYRPLFPSSSSTVDTRRDAGGNVNEVMKYIHRWEMTSEQVGPWDSASVVVDPVGVGITKHPVVVATDPDRIGLAGLEPVEEMEAPSETFSTVDLSSVRGRAAALYRQCIAQAVRAGTGRVKPVGLSEALKARIITKGEGLTTQALHSLQKFMHSTMRSQSTFQLIGRPVDHKVVQLRLGTHLGPDEFYLSGDYSAATDNLAPWVSECIARRIAYRCGLSPEEELLFLRSLTGNVFPIDLSKKEASYERRQRWGQLMGSIVSFPVLCIANAAMCRWSIEVGQLRTRSLHQCGMLVNGDDVCFRATERVFHAWERITAFGGLQSSVGKTYCSPEFVQINSANFFRRRNSDDTADEPILLWEDSDDGPVAFESHFIESKYVNLGLMFGFKRSSEGGSSTVGLNDILDVGEASSLGARCRDLISCCPRSCRDRVMLGFLKRHKEVLEKVRVPWYVPEEFGGVGLPSFLSDRELASGLTSLPSKPDFGPSELDRRVFIRLREKQHDRRFFVGRLPRDVRWSTHTQVMDSFPAGFVQYGEPSPDQEKEWGQIYAASVFSLIFRKSDKLVRDGVGAGGLYKETMPEIVGQRFGETLRRNARSWLRASRSNNLPPPCAVETMFSASRERPFANVFLVGLDHELGPGAVHLEVGNPPRDRDDAKRS